MTPKDIQNKVDKIPPTYILVMAMTLVGYYGNRLDTTIDSMNETIVALRITTSKQDIIISNLSTTQHRILDKLGGTTNG